MRVTHYARRSLAAAVLALALAACGKDSNAPSEFNAQGTTSDLSFAESAFSSSQMSSFAMMGGDISAALNGTALVKTSALAVRGAPGSAALYGRELAALVPRSGGALQAAAIPSQYLGTTFVWNADSSWYEASDLPGAPTSGVRFLLYAVDPVLFRPVTPLVEVGYVDITDHSTSTSVDVNVKVVEGAMVYLEYDVIGKPTAAGAVITISGFASNGTTLANFELNNTVSDNNGSPVIAFDYHISVPSRHLTLNWTATQANISQTEVAVTVNFTISGPNGDVQLVGSYGVSGGTLTIKVNGAVFATVNLNGADPVITGADGQPLTPDEETTFQTVLGFYLDSAYVFAGLLAPVV